jgi:hypothetical protein
MIMACYYVLSEHLPGMTEETHQQYSVNLVSDSAEIYAL